LPQNCVLSSTSDQGSSINFPFCGPDCRLQGRFFQYRTVVLARQTVTKVVVMPARSGHNLATARLNPCPASRNGGSIPPRLHSNCAQLRDLPGIR
jgi:hypothetical protein